LRAAAQEGVGHALAPHHAVFIARRHAAGRDQHLPDLANRVFLAGGLRADAHQSRLFGQNRGVGQHFAHLSSGRSSAGLGRCCAFRKRFLVNFVKRLAQMGGLGPFLTEEQADWPGDGENVF
jgi:hypothetical protein